MSAPDVSIAVLAYNEAENIGPVLSELVAWSQSAGVRMEIVVIDDGSTDATKARASAFVEQVDFRLVVVSHAQNRGMGAALKTAASASTGEYFTFVPADGQIPPSAVEALWAAAQKGHDLVLSTYKRRDDGLHRKVLSAGLRGLIWMVHGVRIKSEGPYMVRRRLFDPTQIDADTFFLNFELPIRLVRAEVSVASVVVECRARLSGVSKTAQRRRVRAVASELTKSRLNQLSTKLRRLFL